MSKAEVAEQKMANLEEANALAKAASSHPTSGSQTAYQPGHLLQPAPLQSSISRAKVSRGTFKATENDLSTEDGEPWVGAPNAASQFQAKLPPHDPDSGAKLPPPGQGLFAHLM
mgnify:CR=1 FL=1